MPNQAQASLHSTTGHIWDGCVRRRFCESEEIRDDRRRKGLCETCVGLNPIQCFKIKRRIGGIIRDKVPLTTPGKVFHGICLDCHPNEDPDRDNKRRGHGNNGGKSQLIPITMDRESFQGKNMWSNSAPNPLLQRQRDFLDLQRCIVPTRDFAFSLDCKDSCLFVDERDAQEQEQKYVEEVMEKIQYNIFNEPIVKRTKKQYVKQAGRRDDNATTTSTSPCDPPNQQSHAQQSLAEEYFEDQTHAPAHLDYPTDPTVFQQQSSERDCGRQVKSQKLPSLPSLLNINVNNNNYITHQSESNGEDGSLDALAALCAQYSRAHPEDTFKFVPGSHLVLPNSELCVPIMADDLSVLTPATCFQGRGSLALIFSSRKLNQQTQMVDIGESSSEKSSERQRSMVSHKIREPAVPIQVVQHPSKTSSQSNVESYLESLAPPLLTLREIIIECTLTGDDAAAIDSVTQALIHDNATSMSMDLALFSLTTLWILARKSDENKRKIIFEGLTFNAIIEAMQIYRERSTDIQTRACGVLWSLSMDPKDRKHIAQGDGCQAILSAMLEHSDDDALQAMALGSLKVLSFDNIAKSTLRLKGTMSIVTDIMQKHIRNPTIQSEGCVILGNLAVDNANQFVFPVSEGVVHAVIRAMLNHPDSLEVHEATCFTLISLASSTVNMEMIRRNAMTEDVGNFIFTLLR